jgi:hypothetical protein
MNLTLLVVLTHFWFAAIPLSESVPASGPVITGMAVDWKTQRPLAGVTVTAKSNGDVQETVSGSDGRFVFLSLRPGTYRICTSGLSGYAASCRGEPKELFGGLEYVVTCILSPTLTYVRLTGELGADRPFLGSRNDNLDTYGAWMIHRMNVPLAAPR